MKIHYPIDRMNDASEAILGHTRIGRNQHTEAYERANGRASGSPALSRYLARLNTHISAHYDNFTSIAQALHDRAANVQALEQEETSDL